MQLSLATPLSDIKGIGPRFTEKLAKLNIVTVKDILYHLPFRYQDFSQIKNIADVEEGEVATVYGLIEKISVSKTFRRHLLVITITITDETGKIQATWFNQRYLLNTFKEGMGVNLAGKVSHNGKKLYLSNPEFEIISHEHYAPKHTARIVPIYPETKGITSKGIRFVLDKVMDYAADIEEFLPANIIESHNFPLIADAFRMIHYPETLAEAAHARDRFAFQDLFLLQLINAREKDQFAHQPASACTYTPQQIKEYFSCLPFDLTLAQKKALYEILEDLAKNHATNRLLQGDVGSGKTIVAAIAGLVVASHKKQAVFMAPTEVLALQHYRTFKQFFKNFSDGVALLTASHTAIFFGDGLESDIQKKELAEYIAAGKVHIIIGTHAVIQKSIAFKDVGLVVIDEQHRFGVHQRALLSERGQSQTETQTDAENNKLLYEDITYTIREAAFAVRKNLGLGHKELLYQKALEEEFKNKNISFQKEKAIDVIYGTKKIGIYRPDFIVENKIIVELKALPYVGKTEERQIWTYLKGSPYKLALLINFSNTTAEIKRIVYDTARQQMSASSQRTSALSPHFLSMSATPIPRTLALTVFGDLELSLINELPKDRKPIVTKIVPPAQRPDAYAFIRQHVQEGRQIYVVCPRIEPSDAQTDADSTPTYADSGLRGSASYPSGALRGGGSSQRKSALWLDAKNVETEYDKLSKKIFPDLRVGMLHGQLKAQEKNAIMKKFKDGDIDILVSTSVIEVGVDVPNATIMMIEGAEKFGLAQLYQFRGRVGRGEHQSYCFLLTDSRAATTQARLKALITAKNGFELAEKDLKFRGPGQFLGSEQTGLPDLAMQAMQNPLFVQSARDEAFKLIATNPTLSEYPYLAAYVKLFRERIHLE